MKILVVEDDSNINEVICEYLKDAGFVPISFKDGAKAADIILQTGDINLFILDILLPGVSGLELLRMLRGSEIYAKTPVIMLTALTDEQTQLTSFNSQADDYVAKPFSPKILVKRVEALFKRCPADAGNSARTGTLTEKNPTNPLARAGIKEVIRAGSIVVDINGYEAFENGRKLDLTLKELELLKVLLSNPHKVLTRQQLLDQVWGYDYLGEERVVDAHIKNLRKKLRTNIIVTVKGVGYKSLLD
jgi:DNA-binding response OmpR family regulator